MSTFGTPGRGYGDPGESGLSDSGSQMPTLAWIEERTRVAVGANANISGKLVFHEPVRIEGRFRGEVSSVDLIVITEGGSIEGRVRTPRLVVLGEMRGEVTASKRVMLGPRARVTGRIESERLSIAEGARLEGDLRISGAPDLAPPTS
ncbi:MAG TPA: polymer-forming cytoskeletal protein [Candidatus Binataceae bacterium]|nr:polymer-forming cytoskeletal protein [Candidatus Binataceae bacterium]